jgi:hypothetical protein
MATVYDFISPFDLKKCKARLERRTEQTSIMASKYARRTQVDVWDINKYTVGFKVYKAPRSSLQLSINIFNLHVFGKMQKRPDGDTVVVYQVTQNPLGVFLEWSGVLLVGILFVVMPYPQWYDSFFNPLAIGVFILASSITGIATYFYRHSTSRELLRIVRQSLGDLDDDLS